MSEQEQDIRPSRLLDATPIIQDVPPMTMIIKFQPRKPSARHKPPNGAVIWSNAIPVVPVPANRVQQSELALPNTDAHEPVRKDTKPRPKCVAPEYTVSFAPKPKTPLPVSQNREMKTKTDVDPSPVSARLFYDAVLRCNASSFFGTTRP